jgi:phenylalanyl-tRNA synthetase beta chain
MERAIRRAVEIIVATAGGVPDSCLLDVCPRPWKGLTVSLRPSRVRVLLGITLTPQEIEDLLVPLGFRVTASGEDLLEVAVPGFRSYDVVREVDLLEEVARAWGYDRFPDELGPFRPGTVPDHPLFRLEEEIRDLLVSRGFLEAQTQAFATESEGEVALSNPVSVQEGFLRRRLLPGLVRRVEYNFARGQRNIRLFELGTVFFNGGKGELPGEEFRLALVLTGNRRPQHWGDPPEDMDLWDLKGTLNSLIPGALLQGVTLREGAPGGVGLVPGEGFSLVGPAGTVVGYGGRMEAGRIDAPAWAGPLWAAEITLPEEPRGRPVPVFRPLPPFPAVDRDLALLLPKGLPARQVEALIRDTAGDLLTDLRIFDLYEGEGVPAGHRSVAFRLRFQSGERTLTDEDVERAVSGVTDRLLEELGVKTRG